MSYRFKISEVGEIETAKLTYLKGQLIDGNLNEQIKGTAITLGNVEVKIVGFSVLPIGVNPNLDWIILKVEEPFEKVRNLKGEILILGR